MGVFLIIGAVLLTLVVMVLVVNWAVCSLVPQLMAIKAYKQLMELRQRELLNRGGNSAEWQILFREEYQQLTSSKPGQETHQWPPCT